MLTGPGQGDSSPKDELSPSTDGSSTSLISFAPRGRPSIRKRLRNVLPRPLKIETRHRPLGLERVKEAVTVTYLVLRRGFELTRCSHRPATKRNAVTSLINFGSYLLGRNFSRNMRNRRITEKLVVNGQPSRERRHIQIYRYLSACKEPYWRPQSHLLWYGL